MNYFIIEAWHNGFMYRVALSNEPKQLAHELSQRRETVSYTIWF